MINQETHEKIGVAVRPARTPVIHLLMCLAALLVSTSFTVSEAISGAMDPVVLTFMRFVLAAVVFAPWIYFKYGVPWSLSLVLRSAVISCCLVVFFCCMFFSLRYTTALNTSVIFTLVPSLSSMYSFFIVRERLFKEQFLALSIALGGVLWVIFRGDLSLLLLLQWNRGDVIFFLGCVCLGLYTPLVQLLHRDEPMAVMTFWVLVTGVLWLLLYDFTGVVSTDFSAVPLGAWIGIVYLAVFNTIVTFFLTQYSVLYLGPTKVAAYSYLYPALVLAIDLMLGRGLPSFKILPGILVVLVAMVVLMRVKEK